MKRKHLLIEAGVQLDTSAKFYLLYVGQSSQDNRDYLFCLARSVDHNYYFHIYDSETSDFLLRVARSLFPASENPLASLNVTQCKIRDYVRACKANVSLSNPANVLANRHQTLKYLDGNYRAAHPHALLK